jgi:hypothetical protein
MPQFKKDRLLVDCFNEQLNNYQRKDACLVGLGSGLVWSVLVWSGLVWSGLVCSALLYSGLLCSALLFITKLILTTLG